MLSGLLRKIGAYRPYLKEAAPYLTHEAFERIKACFAGPAIGPRNYSFTGSSSVQACSSIFQAPLFWRWKMKR